jgi:hypothetical protein
MAKFIHSTEINQRLEDMIRNADRFLWFISPYIKLHERIKDELKKKKEAHALQITVVFGKNDADRGKSISTHDIEFLTSFPNIRILYEKNLHAKFYASEDCSLITSMNLHEFSQNTNKEVGILMQPKNALSKLTDMVIEQTDLGDESEKYFKDIIDHAEKIFVREPQNDSKYLGLVKNYTGSKTMVDKVAETFNTRPQANSNAYVRSSSIEQSVNGYCIRTGKRIPFNVKEPMCPEALRTWRKFGDPDYVESYCHYSGEPSNGETSMARPILKRNWNKAKHLM